jgi:drug/metabolite transporter (DMT)-like permease
MIGAALLAGEHLRRTEGAGVCLAFGGLVYLVAPGVTAPSLTGSLLMTCAGIAWGIYSLRGRSSSAPLAETTHNFILTLPLAVLLIIYFSRDCHLSATGILLAIISRGLASGVGYAVWYATLQGMTATRAAIVQLAVPLLATLGEVLFLAEELSLRLVIAAAAILGGVGLAMVGRSGIPATRPPV